MPDLQTTIALLIVALAAIYVVRSIAAVFMLRTSGACSGCSSGCPAKSASTRLVQIQLNGPSAGSGQPVDPPQDSLASKLGR